MIHQTETISSDLFALPDEAGLRSKFIGADLADLRTPCAIVDVAVVRRNCERMQRIAKSWGTGFRAHVKTHKTAEGTRLMLDNAGGKTTATVVSTLQEAWSILRGGLVKEGIVDDILYGLPLGVDKVKDLQDLRAAVRQVSPSGDRAQVRVMIDHPKQLEALERLAAATDAQPWSVFLKIESGGKRAGIEPGSPLLASLVSIISSSPHVSLHGFYVHAGQSYASRCASEAGAFLTTEVRCVNEAALAAKDVLAGQTRHSSPLVLSVGSTPTAHAAYQQPSQETLRRVGAELHGALELHAGNYPFLDLQQLATGAIPKQSGAMSDVALRILSTVIAEYPERGDAQTGQWSSDGVARASDEAMCDAGGLAMSKDSGPFGSHGHVVEPAEKRGWELGRVSQEHGVLTVREGGPELWNEQWTASDGAIKAFPLALHIGERIQIVPQHACMTAAAHSYYFIVDSSSAKPTKVVDVWVPWKGW